MMTSWKLYHNPRCSQSREALELLRRSGVEFKVIEYLQTPLGTDELRRMIACLESPLSGLVRQKEREFQDEPFDVNSEEEVIARLVQSPRLMERPVLWGGDVAVIGRPLSRIADLLKR